MNKVDERSRKFKLVFYSIILLVSIIIIASAMAGFQEMERALLYLIAGGFIFIDSIVQLYKNKTVANKRVTRE